MEEHSLQHDHELEEHPPWWKGPVKLIITIFLLLIITMWVFSYYAVKLDPEPKNIPTIDDVVPKNLEPDPDSITNNINNIQLTPNDPEIKLIADKIASSSCDGSKVCQAKAIFYFVRDNFDYVSDPNAFEYIKSAKQSLVSGGGDCDDASVLLANLLESIGIKTRFILIPKHVYVQASIPEATKRHKAEDDWVNLDATCKNCRFGEIPYQSANKPTRFI
jgi:transglutaminase-like putative cysteine protease